MSPEFPHAVPTPGDVMGWLRSAGWQAADVNPRWARFRREVDGQARVLQVPRLGEATDYPMAAALLIEDLARLEGRPQHAVLADIRAASADVVRLALKGTRTERGRLAVGASAAALQGARDLFLAAACSVAEPRAAYLGRKHQKAMEFLARAELSRVEHGSFVLCFEVSVPPLLQGHAPDLDAPEPEFDRRVTRRLAAGVAGIEAALRECAVQDSLDPFLERAAEGVSANLCEALIHLLAAADADRLETRVDFAARRPLAASHPRHATVRRDDVQLLREVARGLRGRVSETEVQIQGPVVKLDRPADRRHQRVTLQVEMDERLALVNLDLDEANYIIAHQAHGAMKFVSVAGTLTRQGNQWVLNPSGPIQAVEVPEDVGD